MTTDGNINILRTANKLIDMHGDYAPIVAEERVKELLETEDLIGLNLWLAIARAIEKLQAARKVGENSH